jgi:hypothetical protein
MTFTAQPKRDGRVSVGPTPQTSIPGRPAVTSPSHIPMRDASRNALDGCLMMCGKPRRSIHSLYCDDVCKQRAFRLRHRTNTSVDLTTVRRDLQRRKVLVAHTIYECGTCGEQYVGERRCPDCHTFNKGLGLGGNCPDCDTPILLADLLGEEGLSTA